MSKPKRQEFTVGLTRLAVVYGEVTVKAASAEEAAQKALGRHHEAVWDIDDLYDDGKLHSHVAVSSVFDERGDIHDVGDMDKAP